MAHGRRARKDRARQEGTQTGWSTQETCIIHTVHTMKKKTIVAYHWMHEQRISYLYLSSSRINAYPAIHPWDHVSERTRGYLCTPFPCMTAFLRCFWGYEGCLSTRRTVLFASGPAQPRPANPPCAPTRPARGSMFGLWTRQVSLYTLLMYGMSGNIKKCKYVDLLEF